MPLAFSQARSVGAARRGRGDGVARPLARRGEARLGRIFRGAGSQHEWTSPGPGSRRPKPCRLASTPQTSPSPMMGRPWQRWDRGHEGGRRGSGERAAAQHAALPVRGERTVGSCNLRGTSIQAATRKVGPDGLTFPASTLSKTPLDQRWDTLSASFLGILGHALCGGAINRAYGGVLCADMRGDQHDRFRAILEPQNRLARHSIWPAVDDRRHRLGIRPVRAWRIAPNGRKTPFCRQKIAVHCAGSPNAGGCSGCGGRRCRGRMWSSRPPAGRRRSRRTPGDSVGVFVAAEEVDVRARAQSRSTPTRSARPAGASRHSAPR